MIKVQLVDGAGTARKSCITPIGQLVTAPFAYDQVSNQTMDVVDTAYNFYEPKPQQQFVITGLALYANRNVGVNDATVVIYEATGDDVVTVSKTLFTAEMVKQASRDLIGLNIIVSEGVWINGKTDDDDVFGTVMGYYIPKLS